MIEKVFEREGITLYHGDCMEFLANCTDAEYPLAIVDPPYGSAGAEWNRFGQRLDKYKKSHQTNGHRAREDRAAKLYCAAPVRIKSGSRTTYKQKKNEISWDVAPGPDYFNELFRVSERQIIWGGNYFDLPARRGFAVWDKLQPDGVSFAGCEYAWISWPVNARIFRGAPVQRHNRHGELCQRFHPTQKPEALYRWLLDLFAAPGEMVLDTHAGSCSLLVACYQTGHPAIGVEIDADYCERAIERLKIEMEQPRLIDAPQSRESDGELQF